MVTSKKIAATPTAAFGDIGKIIEKFKLPGVDVTAIVESQRKDMEALAEANRQAYEGIQALAQRRNEILKESLSRWQEAMKNMTGKDVLTTQAALAKESVQKAMNDIRELVDMEAHSRKKAWKVVQDRFDENLANLKQLWQPK